MFPDLLYTDMKPLCTLLEEFRSTSSLDVRCYLYVSGSLFGKRNIYPAKGKEMAKVIIWIAQCPNSGIYPLKAHLATAALFLFNKYL